MLARMSCIEVTLTKFSDRVITKRSVEVSLSPTTLHTELSTIINC